MSLEKHVSHFLLIKVFSVIRYLGEELFNCFRSVQLAIVLLSFLAVGIIIGVVMPQESMVELASIEKKFGSSFQFLHAAGMFNVYSSFWFMTLEVLLFFNLLIGSFKWLKPATLAAIQKNFMTKDLMESKPEAYSLAIFSGDNKEGLEGKISRIMRQFRYKVHHDGRGNLYACKGNISRMGPAAAHLGVLLCLVASLYGTFTGFKSFKTAIPGDTFTFPLTLHRSPNGGEGALDAFKTNSSPSIWLGDVPEWKVQVLDFRIEPDKKRPDIVSQYYSKLKLLSPDGKVLKEDTISVNHPLVYNNVYIYQASYEPTGRFFLEIDGKPLTMEINDQFNKRPTSIKSLKDGNRLIMFPFFARQDPGITENQAIFFLHRQGEAISPGKIPANIRLIEGEEGIIKGKRIKFRQLEMATGLQINKAPEVPLIYLAYSIIIAGTMLCFFSQRQIWLSMYDIEPGRVGVILYPKTNKARLSFKNELFEIQNALSKVTARSNAKLSASIPYFDRIEGDKTDNKPIKGCKV